MEILIVLRNIDKNQSYKDGYLSKSDRNVISEALKLKDKINSRVTVALLAKDIEENGKILKEAMAMGADDSYLIDSENIDLTNQKLCAKILKNFIYKYEKNVDLILFGRLSYNGDSVNIATLVSENLNIKRVMYSTFFDSDGEKFFVKRQIDNEEYLYELERPLLVQSIADREVTRHSSVLDIINAYSVKEILKVKLEKTIEDINYNDGIRHYKNYSKENTLKKGYIDLTGKNDMESAKNLIDVIKRLNV